MLETRPPPHLFVCAYTVLFEVVRVRGSLANTVVDVILVQTYMLLEYMELYNRYCCRRLFGGFFLRFL